MAWLYLLHATFFGESCHHAVETLNARKLPAWISAPHALVAMCIKTTAHTSTQTHALFMIPHACCALCKHLTDVMQARRGC